MTDSPAELDRRVRKLESTVEVHDEQIEELRRETRADAAQTRLVAAEMTHQLDQLKAGQAAQAGAAAATDRWLRVAVAIVTITGAVAGGAVTVFGVLLERGP